MVVVRAAAMEAARVVVVMVAVDTAEAVLVAVEEAEKAEAMVEVRVEAVGAAVTGRRRWWWRWRRRIWWWRRRSPPIRQRSSGRYVSQSYRAEVVAQHRPARQHACPECCCVSADRTPPYPDVLVVKPTARPLCGRQFRSVHRRVPWSLHAWLAFCQFIFGRHPVVGA